MKPSKPVIILSVLTGLLGLVQSGVGLFYQTEGQPFDFTTLHSQTVQISGQGMYAYDTSFKAPILRGTDAVTLFVCIPLLVVALLLYRRGSPRGGLLLVGALGYFVYDSASVVLGVAYNNLFLLYVAFFSASLFAFILAFTAIDRQELAARLSQSRGLPRRGIAILMFVTGLALLFAWLGDILGPLFQGGVPEIASYTTEVTYAFDLGIIAPLSILTGILILRCAPMGYLLSALMLVVLSIVGLMVASQTVFQMLAGISLTPGQFIGKAGSFMVLALIAVWLSVPLFRCVKE
jgi:hypothetical protein